jgi:hypothetical protein
MPDFSPLAGGCLCGAVRYEIVAEPLTLYACHCTDCQTTSGASFTLTLIVRRDTIEVRAGAPELRERPRKAGGRKTIFRCPVCLTALWGARNELPDLATVYAGTLDESASLRPVGHIWTRSVQPWIALPGGELCYETQPPDMRAILRAWRERGTERA